MLVILNMILVFVLAFQAGCMKAMIDVDRIEGKKSNWKLYFFLVADTLISVYLLVSIYGMGINRGTV